MAKQPTPPQTPPAPFGEGAFVCAHCGVHSQQIWHASILARVPSREHVDASSKSPGGLRLRQWFDDTGGRWPLATIGTGYTAEFTKTCPTVSNAYWSQCCNPKCMRLSLWIGGQLQYPEPISWSPNTDLPQDIQNDFFEAASIAAKSPRGAAALLRLCVQKICIHLGKDPKNIDKAIGQLVADGLPERVSQMLDIVRVTGNEAVHPGTMDFDDDNQTVDNLFRLVNLIADELLTRPRETEEIWNKLPASKRQAIDQRNAKAKGGAPESSDGEAST